MLVSPRTSSSRPATHRLRVPVVSLLLMLLTSLLALGSAGPTAAAGERATQRALSHRVELGAWVEGMTGDPTRLAAPVRHEPADGELFPHIYGPIPLSAVIDVRSVPENR